MCIYFSRWFAKLIMWSVWHSTVFLRKQHMGKGRGIKLDTFLSKYTGENKLSPTYKNRCNSKKLVNLYNCNSITMKFIYSYIFYAKIHPDCRNVDYMTTLRTQVPSFLKVHKCLRSLAQHHSLVQKHANKGYVRHIRAEAPCIICATVNKVTYVCLGNIAPFVNQCLAQVSNSPWHLWTTT